MRSVLALSAILAFVACGGGGGGDDDSALPDAMLPCGADLCAALGAPCGEAVDSCGGEVDCGRCEYQTEQIGTVGTDPAIAFGEVVQVAYVETQPDYELRLAARTETGWSSEPVTQLGGPPLGPLDLVVGADGIRWIAYVDDLGQVRVASAPKGESWMISDPLGVGVAVAIGLDSAGLPVVAIAGVVGGTTGVFILSPDDTGWDATPVASPLTAGAPTAIGLVVRGRELSLAWRDPGDDVLRFATGKGQAFTIETVDPSVPAPRADGALSLSVDGGGREHVIYGRAGEAMHAVRTGELWQPLPLPFENGDGDNTLAVGLDGTLHAALYDAAGLRVLDGIAGYFLSQTVSAVCTDGAVDLAVGGGGELHLVQACDEGLSYLTRSGPE